MAEEMYLRFQAKGFDEGLMPLEPPHTQFVPIQKLLICPVSALREKFNHRNINHMPAVKFSTRLDLEQIILFLDGHQL
jgi:hypothetical protein